MRVETRNDRVVRCREQRRASRVRWRARNLGRSRRLRARRIELELTMREAAELALIPLETWKGYENGWNPVPAHRLEAVARALQCSIDWLVTGREAGVAK